MTFLKPADDRTQVKLALEASIHIGLAILLATACLLILRPFIPLLAWGIIIAVSAYPGFQKLQLALGGRGVLSAILFTVLLLAFLIVPVVLLAETQSRVSRPLWPTSRTGPSSSRRLLPPLKAGRSLALH